MDNTLTAFGHDLYLEYQEDGAKPYIREHRVWDGERFFRSQLEACVKAEPPVLVRVSSRDQYIHFRNHQRT